MRSKGGALAQQDWHPQGAGERPLEDPVRGWPSASQQGGRGQQPAPRALDPGLPASGTVRNASLLFQPHGLWHLITAGSLS